MHVAFFTQGEKVPASRFRVDQLVPALQKHIECTVLPASPSVYGDYKGFAGGWRAFAKPFSIASRVKQLRAVPDVDVIWMQRPLTEYFTTALERFVTKRKPAVFDFDDAIFHNRWGLEARKLRTIIDRVDRVVAGNSYLAEFVGLPDKTTIIPTVVDETRYTPRPDPDGPFTIVWTGMSHNLRELAPYLPALRTVLTETGGRFVVVADRLNPILGDLPVDFIQWSPDSEVAALAAGHAGVMPLADTPYNRGKCAFKLIQYMARGIPVVASPVGANREVVRDGVEGFYAVTIDDWANGLLSLARDRDLRVRMGNAGRKRVEDHYSVSAVVPQYLDVLRAIA
ncbi:MAG TPA: glycosyltransferase family 4 protein [Kofleriaceae bacterium]|nr:glycosyltransferase family 4 protein [Kofleriaceae bacterium]